MMAIRETVLSEWEARVRHDFKQASHLRRPIIINTIPAFYDNIVQSLISDNSRSDATDATSLASEHGGERARLTNYDPDALILEYQLLRSIIFEVAEREAIALTVQQTGIINASIDNAIRESVTAFSLVVAALREQFVMTLTHDLKTPLHAATMGAEIVAATAATDQAKQAAQTIQRNLRRMDEMINSLLDTMVFHQGEKLKLNLSHFDMRALAEEICEQTALRDGRTFEVVGQALKGWWDRGAMRRVLENLINNAVKYSPPNTAIRIGVEEMHEQLLLCVHNQGPPIPVDEQESVFQVFRRARQAKEGKIQGWGIGLPYVRAVAESHGGSVFVDSSAERGTTFSVDIPVDARPFQDMPAAG